ncbi:hypothetical protein, partial [Roseovarius sp. SYSU LYC5161]|uniref:hypothetical protein n=1 Tax=Roseovarius halophilus (ex Wu et al. 2025) TaxID=3376060 RepID=UPI00399969B9
RLGPGARRPALPCRRRALAVTADAFGEGIFAKKKAGLSRCGAAGREGDGSLARGWAVIGAFHGPRAALSGKNGNAAPHI